MSRVSDQERYKAICRKMGYDLFKPTPYKSECSPEANDDRLPPYSVLDNDELVFLEKYYSEHMNDKAS